MSLLEQLSLEEQKQFERFNAVVNVVWERLENRPTDVSLYWVDGTLGIGHQVAFLSFHPQQGQLIRSGYVEPGIAINFNALPKGDKLLCFTYLLSGPFEGLKKKHFAMPVLMLADDAEEVIARRLLDGLGEFRKYLEYEASKK